MHGFSYHTDRELITNVNETNPGVGCRKGPYEFGVYENSFGDWSAYGVRDWMLSDHLGLFAGVATGYAQDRSVADHGVTPVGGGVMHYKGFTVRATPTYNSRKGKPGVTFGASYAYQF